MMIPLNPEDEKKMLELEESLAALLHKYNGADTKATLIQLQFDLNDIILTYLPMIVEYNGDLLQLVGFSLRFKDDGKMTFVSKLRENSSAVVAFFNRKGR